MAIIKAASFDPSFTNWGVGLLSIDTDALTFEVDDLQLVQTRKDPDTKKAVRKNSDALRRATELHKGVHGLIGDARLIFAEIPAGGQSYDAVYGFGIVVGIMASMPVPVIQVTPSEAKLAAVGTRTASKQEMIEWAFEEFPSAPWIVRRGKPTLANEHLADSLAIARAGIMTDQFRQLAALFRAAA